MSTLTVQTIKHIRLYLVSKPKTQTKTQKHKNHHHGAPYSLLVGSLLVPGARKFPTVRYERVCHGRAGPGRNMLSC